MTAAVSAPLTLYSARVCPWAQRSTLMLQETGLEHSIYEIDLQNKPEWYNSKINPASKVPVLQIGGKDENSEGVPRIPESAVLLELISDLAAQRGGKTLTPEDPIERAEARYFIERFIQIVQGPMMALLYRGDLDKIPETYKGIEEIQAILKKRNEKTGGPFWHGKEPGLADLGVAPFVGRLEVYSRTIDPISTTDLHKTIFDKYGKYAVFSAYADAIMARPSWAKTFDEDYIVSYSKERIAKMRAGAN